MTPTEISLLAVHRTPTVLLGDICEKYLNLSPRTADAYAAMHTLPFPTFRLSSSRKAPRVVSLADLAAFIDSQAAQAKQNWETSQV